MIGGKHQQDISGNNNIQAGGDVINNITYYQNTDVDILSAIEKVLSGIYKNAQNGEEFIPIDTKSYTIENKINFNEISYFDPLEDFREGYYYVKNQIKILSEVDPACETSITQHIKHYYRKIRRQNTNCSADKIIEKVCSEIETALIGKNTRLALEEQKAVEFVVFYIFAECKIFNKPPSDYASQ